LDETWTQELPQHNEQVLKEGFIKSKDDLTMGDDLPGKNTPKIMKIKNIAAQYRR
jgi:hypothetical protein